MSSELFRPPGPCPNCGVEVRRGARACPGCGASDDSGWNEEAAVSGLDLPDEDFDYEAFVENEFGERRRTVPKRKRLWTLVGILILLVMAGGFLAAVLRR